MKAWTLPLAGLSLILFTVPLEAQWELTQGPFLPRIDSLSAHPSRPDEFLLRGPTAIYLTTNRAMEFTRVAEHDDRQGRIYRHPADPNRVLTANLFSSNGGRSWQRIDGPKYTAFGSFPTRADLVWATSDGQDGALQYVEVFSSSDGGSSFRIEGGFAHQNRQVSSTHICADALDKNLLYVVGGENLGEQWTSHLFVSEDGGRSWTRSPGPEGQSDQIIAVACDPARAFHLWLLTRNVLFRSRDGGASWESSIDVSTGNWPYYPDDVLIHPDANGLIWMKAGDQLWLSTTDGAAWTQMTTPWSEVVFRGSSFSPVFQVSDRAYASNGETLHFTEDRGRTWTPLSAPDIPARLFFVATDVTDSSRAYAGECCETDLFRTLDGGASWSPVLEGSNGLVAHPNEPGHLYSFTGGTGLMESLDAGSTWSDLGDFLSQTGAGGSNFVSALRFSPDNPMTIYIGAGGYDFYDESDPSAWGKLFFSLDGGSNWSRIPFPEPNAAIAGVAVRPGEPGTIVLVTSNKGIFRTIDGGASWNRVSDVTAGGGRHFHFLRVEMDPANPNLIVAALNRLLVSEDFGATWRDRSPSDYSRSVLLYQPSKTVTRIVVPANDNRGVVHYSDNLGRSWNRVPTGIGDRIETLAASGDGTLYAATQRRGVARGRLP